MAAPERIYLQWCDCKDCEVTWCVDQVAMDDQVDVEYIRYDLVENLVENIIAAIEAAKDVSSD